MLARRPRVLLLDEPSSALDLHWQLAMLEAVRNDVAERQAIAVLALHDINLAMRSCDRVLVLSERRCQTDGAPLEVITPELVRRVYGVEGRVERCSQGRPVFLLDQLARP